MLHNGLAGHWFYIIFVMFLIGFFVAAKFAFTRLRRNAISDIKLSDKEKLFLGKQFINSNRYIHTMQFFIIALVMILGYLCLDMAEEFTRGLAYVFDVDLSYLSWIGLLIVVLLMTTLVLAVSEIVPKAIALTYPESVFMFSSHFAANIGKLIFPFVYIATTIGKLLLRSSKANVMSEIDLAHSEEEIRTLVSHSQLSGQIDKVESELIENVFDFVDRLAKEVMIPRQEVICLYTDNSYEENKAIIQDSKHTRYPLCEEDKDHIIGLIHVKDFWEQEEKARKNIRFIKREILIIPEVMKLSILIQTMRTQRIYQSIVVDEYGSMVGLVGLEDIVEELVGDIKGEHEEMRDQIVSLGGGAYDLDGTLLLEDAEELLQINLEDADEDTLGGFIFGLLGQTPELGDEVEYGSYRFKVIDLQGYRISRVEVTPIEEEEGSESHE